MTKIGASLIFVFLLLAVLKPLLALEYQVNKDKENLVKFISDAPIENFDGTTDKIDGYIIWRGDDPADSSEIYLEVDLNTLDTGIGLRNRHMRENYLETEQYPFTYFKGKIIDAGIAGTGERQVTAEGSIFIHGIEKPLRLQGTMIAVENGFRIRCSFNVKLSDFNIEIPSIMFYKINENMDLRLDFYISPANSAQETK